MFKRSFFKLKSSLFSSKQDLLRSLQVFDSVFLMDSHDYLTSPYLKENFSPEFVLGFGEIAEMEQNSDPLSGLKEISKKFQDDWLLGYLSYDLKNKIEKLDSSNPDVIEFPLLDFFCPRYLLIKKNNEWSLGYLPEIEDSKFDPEKFLENILSSEKKKGHSSENIRLIPDLNKQDYLKVCNKVLDHIHRGDIYEMNLCIHFSADKVILDPVAVYLKMSDLSPTPFAGFLKRNGKFLLCASPERYLAGDKDLVISQPIKGTAKRDPDPVTDQAYANALKNDPKERAENVMIVDLVRNDLSKFAQKASVKVEELLGIYPFPKVWQMISTVSCIPEKEMDLTDMISASFPMGSMTGAPKVRAMQLIDQYENTSRGLYSGSMGYLAPGGSFDLNVVIRSILFNSQKQTLSFSAGSAITSLSDPEKEYDECILKAKLMAQSLGLDIHEI